MFHKRGRRHDRVAEAAEALPWSEKDVVDVSMPAFALRTYLEQTEIRKYAKRAADELSMRSACDLGAGFGRLTPVLGEFCDDVTAFEREASFVEIGQRLHPGIRFERVESLGRLPADQGAFDFVLVFTVLQHCPDPLVEEIASELRRVTRNQSFALLCEETDENFAGDFSRPEHCTVGRSIERYQALMAPFDLLDSAVRMIEPGYERPNVGSYMLFRRGGPV